MAERAKEARVTVHRRVDVILSAEEVADILRLHISGKLAPHTAPEPADITRMQVSFVSYNDHLERAIVAYEPAALARPEDGGRNDG